VKTDKAIYLVKLYSPDGILIQEFATDYEEKANAWAQEVLKAAPHYPGCWLSKQRHIVVDL
jgi:hypothetical protein